VSRNARDGQALLTIRLEKYAPSWLSRQFFLTIRGKIMLAFTFWP
jgi:hypothetical protein